MHKLPKGTFDILPLTIKEGEEWKNSHRWHHIESVMRKLARDYGYHEMRTPIFESTDVFTTGVGETSDIVSKEMYTFCDKGDRSVTLRPEGTAAGVRSFVENHLDKHAAEHKLFYIGPFFRYDRPQAGRFRQFHQFGVEAFGLPGPEQDVEVIDMLCELFRRLEMKETHLLLNTIGDQKSRETFKAALRDFLIPHKKDLSADSQTRLDKNPLRILDSKSPQDQKVVANAPSIQDFLSDSARDHFETVKKMLTSLGISYTIEPKLVRGLDYYNQTVFEVTSGVLGAQNSIGAGGRYDGLVKRFGGNDVPSVGFSAGIERILSTMQGQNIAFPKPHAPFVHFIPLDESSREKALELTYTLRHKSIPAETYLRGRKMQKALQDITATRSTYCIILGENELKSGKVELKEMASRKTETVQLDSLTNELQTRWKSQ